MAFDYVKNKRMRELQAL